MLNTRATLDSINVKPDEKGPLTTIKLKARLSREELTDLYGFLLLEDGATGADGGVLMSLYTQSRHPRRGRPTT